LLVSEPDGCDELALADADKPVIEKQESSLASIEILKRNLNSDLLTGDTMLNTLAHAQTYQLRMATIAANKKDHQTAGCSLYIKSPKKKTVFKANRCT